MTCCHVRGTQCSGSQRWTRLAAPHGNARDQRISVAISALMHVPKLLFLLSAILGSSKRCSGNATDGAAGCKNATTGVLVSHVLAPSCRQTSQILSDHCTAQRPGRPTVPRKGWSTKDASSPSRRRFETQSHVQKRSCSGSVHTAFTSLEPCSRKPACLLFVLAAKSSPILFALSPLVHRLRICIISFASDTPAHMVL